LKLAAPQRHAALIAMCDELSPVRTAVVHPCDRASLEGAIAAAEDELIIPVLVGNTQKIRALAAREGLDIGSYQIVDAPHSHAAAAQAVALARAGSVHALMKGSLHSDELMHEVSKPDSGLHTERRISHAFVLDVPSYAQPLIVTDGVVNIAPTLDEKRDIVQNAIDLAHTLRIAEPKMAILSAVETVNSKMLSTIDAAALCKMADRGQITGAQLDGPLALDDAVNSEAAREKGIVSAVAGQANILLVPGIEAGNMLAKELILFAGADAAGIVLGARVPIILTSRADTVRTRIASAAIALLLYRSARTLR
jgi:phosphate acetyltransferase